VCVLETGPNTKVHVRGVILRVSRGGFFILMSTGEEDGKEDVWALSLGRGKDAAALAADRRLQR